ncbi:hypothetical protein Zmor_025127 [Zophobas morio]|uniref:Uncharacterized protein n=1 Tax=Zophobas morio TaxID=2755281 RepID=A0AA38HRJ0_9CUCU|nr:hypothetical protein Zmor_025127 [Zophobas morio]
MGCQNPTQYPNYNMFPYNPYNPCPPCCIPPIIIVNMPQTSKVSLPSTKSVDHKTVCKQPCPKRSSTPIKVCSPPPAEAVDDVSMQVEIVPRASSSKRSASSSRPQISSQLINSSFVAKLKQSFKLDGIIVEPLTDRHGLIVAVAERLSARKRLMLEDVVAANAIREQLVSGQEMSGRDDLQSSYYQHKRNIQEQVKKYLEEEALLVRLLKGNQQKISPCELPANDKALKVRFVSPQQVCQPGTDTSHESTMLPSLDKFQKQAAASQRQSPCPGAPSQRSHLSGSRSSSGRDPCHQSISLPPVAEIQQQAAASQRQSPCPGAPSQRSHLSSSRSSSGRDPCHQSISLPPVAEIQQQAAASQRQSPCQGAPSQRSHLSSSRSSSGRDPCHQSISLPPVAEIQQQAAASQRQSPCPGSHSSSTRSSSSGSSRILNPFYKSSLLQEANEEPFGFARPENLSSRTENLYEILDYYLLLRKCLMYHVSEAKNLKPRLACGAEPETRRQLMCQYKEHKKKALKCLKESVAAKEEYDLAMNILIRSLHPQVPPEEDAAIEVEAVPAEASHRSRSASTPIPQHPQDTERSQFLRSSFIQDLQKSSFRDLPPIKGELSNMQQYMYDLLENMIVRKKNIVRNLLAAKEIRNYLGCNPQAPNRAQLMQSYEQYKQEAVNEIVKCGEEKEELDSMTNMVINEVNDQPAKDDFFIRLGIVPGQQKQEEFVSLQADSQSECSQEASSKNDQMQSFVLHNLSHYFPEMRDYDAASASQRERLDRGRNAYDEFQRSILSANTMKRKIEADKLLTQNDEAEQRNMQKMMDSYFRHRQNALGHLTQMEQCQK